MPRTKADGPPPNWDALYEAAAPQAGYFTLAEAIEAGFSAPLLHYYCGGRVDRIGRGIYRLRHFPYTPEDEFVPLWLWTGKAGVFSHETALQLHGLSDALPARYHLTVPTSWRTRRLRVPQGVSLHYGDPSPVELDWHGPVPVTAPLPTLRDCAAAHIQPDILDLAIRQAVDRGLVSPVALDVIKRSAI